MHTLSGGCHCGNILLELELSQDPSAYRPRACDCTFCSKHGAAYISDAQGSLRIQIGAERDSRMYRQGSGIAECLLCANCGVLVGALYRCDGQTYAAVNAKVIDVPGGVGEEQPVSPKSLVDSDKVGRWQNIWFSNVSLGYGRT
jgi:hypothetical protein